MANNLKIFYLFVLKANIGSFIVLVYSLQVLIANINDKQAS